MKNNWFRWEREASIHLLFPTLEVFYQPLKTYSGVSAPTMILVFKKGVVTWCIKEDEFIDYGEQLLKRYRNPLAEKKMVFDIKKGLTDLKKQESKIDSTDLTRLSNKELINLHQSLYSSFIQFYTMGAIGTPLSFSAEIILKKKGLTDEQLNQLTTPDEISYIAKADKYLLKHKDIKGFINKYFWINNNYSGPQVITQKEIKKRLNELGTNMTIVKSVPARRIKLDTRSKRLIELLKHYAVYKDNRKKEILIYLHYIDLILKEVARRTKLDIDEIRATVPTEIGDVLNGKLSRRELRGRVDYSVIVWENSSNNAKLLTGKDGKKWESKTLERLSIAESIHGRSACPGKVIGKVRILFKAEDSDQMEKGEVLVTFMTSPDFMPAIRKASAIITNLGGVTSHAAIISRELNIPCIVGTKIATQILKDGDMVEVDANKGVVKIL